MATDLTASRLAAVHRLIEENRAAVERTMRRAQQVLDAAAEQVDREQEAMLIARDRALRAKAARISDDE